MSSFFKKIWSFVTRIQVVVVLLAFALMVLSSYLYVSDTELKHLRKNAEDAISNTEASIKSDMLEPESLLGSVSETIRDIILRGNDIERVHDYIKYINLYVQSDNKKRMVGIIGFYGFFDAYGDRFLAGSDEWVPPDDYDPSSRPWFTAAVEAAGNVSTTEPYIDIYSNDVSITFSRRIFDDDDIPLGIIGLDINLERIRQYAVDTRFAENGYGFLLSKSMELIAHPNPDMLGMRLRDVPSSIAKYEDELRRRGNVSEAITADYRGVESIVFMSKLQNGWYMGVVTPKDNYYQSTRNMAVILSALGAAFATLLSWMLIRISREKVRADERIQIMFNSTPLAANFWDKDFNVIDCNMEAIQMFGLSSKQEYIKRFGELQPIYQPNGRLTQDVGDEYIARALLEGYCRFDFMHQKLNGEPIPCEITLVRVKYGKDFILVGYTRDLRSQEKMLRTIEQRTRLLNTVNSAASSLLSSNDGENFETALLESFELLGICLDVDRVQIWRNEVLDGDLNFVLRYEWLSEYGKTRKPVPIGLHFPYSMKKEWETMFLNGEYINAPLCELPDDDQNFLGCYDMKSIVIIPMFLDGNFWGFFSIDDCRRERTFPEEEINILSSAGLMMSSAVNRNLQAAKMREADERMRIMIDAAPLCAVFWDKNLKLIDCNLEAVKLFGFSSKEEFIEKFTTLSPEYQPDGIRSTEKGGKLVRTAFSEGYSRLEWMHQKPDGEPIPADVICIRVKHQDEFTVTEYIRDLREQKAMIAEMRKAEVAEESSRAKSGFLAKMSHEIRTPMNAILGITEIQLQDDTLPNVTKEALEKIYNSGDLLLGIINDILDLSKIEAGKFELINEKYEIASVIYDTVQLNIMRYESKPIEFRIDVNENIPVLLIGDELRIKQILNNLLSNAFKYTQEGQIDLTINIEENSRQDGSVNLVFCISDTGQGMTAEQVAKLGTEYYRINQEANRKTEGTGLGMNITMNLIEMMNGSIDIDSTPGMGSTFTIRLPQGRLDPSLPNAGDVIGEEMAENLKKLNLNNVSKIRNARITREFMPYGRVLVVDDVETNLYVAKGLMAPYGLSIDTALSGFEAVDKIRDGAVYDIVFMDHMMPRMDGIEAAKIIRSMGYNAPIVALTANAMAGQAELFYQNGFDDFISKPIDIRQLNASLNKLIRDKQTQEVIEEARKQKHNLYASGRGFKISLDPQLAEFFVRDAEKAASILEAIYVNRCRRSDDLSTFVINTHAMKSALANIGEPNLSAVALRLEQGGRDQNIKMVMEELPEFLQSLYEVIDKLKAKEEGADAASGEEGDNSFLTEKLTAIKKACAALNKKAAKEALAELKQKAWPQTTKEWLSAIAEKLLHSEFEETAKDIENYLKQISG